MVVQIQWSMDPWPHGSTVEFCSFPRRAAFHNGGHRKPYGFADEDLSPRVFTKSLPVLQALVMRYPNAKSFGGLPLCESHGFAPSAHALGRKRV